MTAQCTNAHVRWLIHWAVPVPPPPPKFFSSHAVHQENPGYLSAVLRCCKAEQMPSTGWTKHPKNNDKGN